MGVSRANKRSSTSVGRHVGNFAHSERQARVKRSEVPSFEFFLTRVEDFCVAQLLSNSVSIACIYHAKGTSDSLL